MRKVLFILLFIPTILFGQTVVKPDTCIDMKYYKSYYSYAIEAPSYCTYMLYKGGGDEPRNNISFSGTLPHFDYYKSGYDRGHLVPAEDLAFSREAVKSTFKYWNCVPQTPRLNRGIWKTIENDVRKQSQQDTLWIIVGASNYKNGVPKWCWKVVVHNSIVEQIYVYDQEGQPKTPTKTFKNKIEAIRKRLK